MTVDVAGVAGAEFSTEPSDFKLITNIRNLRADIPSGVRTISASAFAGCAGLISVNIPNTVTQLAGSAFFNCTGLTSVEIPSSVGTILSDTFYGCTNITSIVVHKAEGSITGAPWGAINATVTWDG